VCAATLRVSLVPLYLILPLIAALVYAAGALLVKRSAELGGGVWRTAFIANIVTTLLYQPMWLLGGELHPELWWQPTLVAICFVAGQWFTFISLEKGDVSVATPVLGIKILLVAVLVAVGGGEALRWQLWVAAILATAGIVLLNRPGGRAAHHDVGRTIVTAGLAAVAYALCDVLVQHWSPRWGVGRFLPVALTIAAVFSCAFIFRFRAPLTAIPRGTWPWLMAGTFTLGVQSVVFVSTVAQWGHAASVNVVYSSRGLWSVVLVWVFGHWVSSREQQLGSRVLGWRLAGAGLMMSAIVLVLL
jgi:drug/metabolite transporter (DMT)-like permease